MHTLATIDSSILSLIILTIIYFNAANRLEKVFLHSKLFLALIQANMGLIIIDILGWVFNGKSGVWNLILNWGFNLLLYIAEPLPALLWVLYADFQVFHDESRLRKGCLPLLMLFISNAILALLSLANGWFFRVDSRNIYHRGEYFWIHVAFGVAPLLYSLLLTVINRTRIEKRHYYALLLFGVPQILGCALQVSFYGVSFTWTGMMLSLLIIYFYVQNRDLNTDYLTGVSNRRQLDLIIREKIRNSTAERSFSVILIDLNGFKQINDQFGHDVGDAALQDAVKLIRASLRSDDLIARYGGDEFYIILDLKDQHLLEAAVARINSRVAQFNANSAKPYKLSFCMGYDVYDYHSKTKADEFLKHIDRLMYKNKRLRQITKS